MSRFYFRQIFIILVCFGFLGATEYRVTHLRKGTRLNVREIPVVNNRTAVASLPYNAIGIKIKECKKNRRGREWCYIFYPIGGKHIEGWVSRYYLEPMNEWFGSEVYIKNFLRNYYLADEENFLDKLRVFYHFPMQQYMYDKGVTHMQLRAIKVDFYKKWPYRTYDMMDMKVLKRREMYIDVQTKVIWSLRNSEEYRSGQDIQKIRLVHNGEQFQVLAVKNLDHTTTFSNEDNATFGDGNQTTIITENGNKRFYIKIGSFFMQPNEEYFSNINRLGFNYVQFDGRDSNGNRIKRIYIGPYKTNEEAMESLYRVRATINENAYIQSF